MNAVIDEDDGDSDRRDDQHDGNGPGKIVGSRRSATLADWIVNVWIGITLIHGTFLPRKQPAGTG